MIMLCSTHKAALASLVSSHEASKEELKELYYRHIQSLERQIEDLKNLIFIPSHPSQVPLVHLEADAVMSQKNEIIEVDQEELEKQEFILAERDRIMSGNYGTEDFS